MVDLQNRTLKEANFLLDNNTTIRGVAKAFDVSKSTVHYDLSRRLKTLDYALFERVNKTLKNNFNQKHFRGGNATKQMYQKKRIKG